MRRHPILTLSVFAYLGVVGWVTLSPQTGSAASNPIWRLATFFGRHQATEWLTFATLEFLANIAMFVPVGFLLGLLLGRRRWWLAILAGVALSLAIEYTQLYLPTRVSDVRDLVANSLGAVVGWLGAFLLMTGSASRHRV